MNRLYTALALTIVLTMGTASQAMAEYSLGGFNVADTFYTQINAIFGSYHPFSHLQNDRSANYNGNLLDDVLNSLNSNPVELFVLGGGSQHDNKLAGGGVNIDFNKNTNWDSVQTYYDNVVLADLFMTFYDTEAGADTIMSFNDLAYAVPHQLYDANKPESINTRMIRGFTFAEATKDATINGFEIKAGDIIMGFEQHYNYVNGTSHLNPSFSDMVLVMRAPNSPVPVPGAVWLLGSGLAGIVGLRRRIK